ncbi:MAG: hypothetical protein KME28_17565 [Pelatocladus maniniholoensis HA4357-MV3]|jgi:hypothetical protein|uniref:Uncharacterized protein n=1 Tax=Pelatocladus maniniholoensis HA4357-MV3 TaxID=1117104 RepID=A0A9E3H9I3_9NOST|nr:hypothetical protein [Pelatocladus maniniholoensis HA4357-MV3]BAZ69004.1 hypothetical protein NIES4106_37730 [Fischerella sp. NIES-4106]
MNFPRVRRILAVVLLSVLLLTTACTPKEPGRFDQVQQESSRQKTGQAVAKNATQGSEFNKFFPPAGDGYERVYTQEKKGFAEAKLKKDGKEIAMLAISDTKSTPTAAAKFASSTKQIAGYPAVEVGTTQTAILVNDRYQVKVLSRSPSFQASDRETWIKKFNLAGLARLK